MDVTSVLLQLQQLHGTLQAGDPFPTQRELLERFDASERTMRGALDELHRQGKIVRRQGAGTFVADFSPLLNGHDGSTTQGVSVNQIQSRTIVAVATPDHSFFDRAVEMLFTQVESADLSLVCLPFNPATSILRSVDKPLGYILFRRHLLPLAQKLQQEGHRVVLIATPGAGESFDVPHVSGNQEVGGYMAMKHLLQLGHRRIAYRAKDEDFLLAPRGKGCLRALREFHRTGGEAELNLISDAQLSIWREHSRLAEEFWAKSDAPTGVIEWNDHEAVFLMALLSYIGVDVPGQVSVVGYDNLPEGEKAIPSLTTVDSAIEHQLQAALDLLVSELPLNPNHSVVVLPTFISRDSSALVAK